MNKPIVAQYYHFVLQKHLSDKGVKEKKSKWRRREGQVANQEKAIKLKRINIILVDKAIA